MGYITIETVTNSKNRVAFGIESDGLYKINSIFGSAVETLDKIYGICIFDNILVLITEDRDFRNGAKFAPFLKDDRSENNIVAYDLHGNFLWNIGSIVGDIKMAFSGVSCILKADAEKDFGVTMPGSADVLLKCIAGGFTFIVDAINQKMLYKISGRVK